MDTKPRPTHGWWPILAYVVLHNIWAAGSKRKMLSEAVDDALLVHPLLTRAGIAAVALHLGNGVPPRYDPLHLMFVGAGQLSEKWGGHRRRA